MPPEKALRPVSLACIACRKKHLRCDAKQPVCGRCIRGKLECNYTPSRRGHKATAGRESEAGHTPDDDLNESDLLQGRRMSQPEQSAIGTPLSIPTTDPGHLRSGRDGQNSDTVLRHELVNRADLPRQTLSSTSYDSSSTFISTSNSTSLSKPFDEEQLVNLFYAYFHPAHPILLPKAFYASRSYPDYLRQVVYLIGSHFSSLVSNDRLRMVAAEGLAINTEKTPSMVQGRLLFAIVLHGRNEIQEAQAMLARAVSLALEIGMNKRDFASRHGGQVPVEEESLRRTWWELYVVDSIMAGFWRRSEFNVQGFDSDVLLPCEELTYLDANCMPNPPTVSQFDRRLFTDDDTQYSSFCYRIEAARILARVLALSKTNDAHQDQVQAVDNALAGWIHHLPTAKADVFNTLGEADEILFQAHMMIQYASLFLHFPRSNLISTPVATADIAGSQRGLQISPASTQHTHAIKATEASKQLSNLAALRVPVQNHTPFFICGLVLGAVVQLSAACVHGGNCIEQHRDRVALIIGVLKSLGRTWKFSQVVLQQIKKVAADVFDADTSGSNGSLPVPAYSNGLDMTIGGDYNWSDNLDIQNLQNLIPFDTEMVYADSL